MCFFHVQVIGQKPAYDSEVPNLLGQGDVGRKQSGYGSSKMRLTSVAGGRGSLVAVRWGILEGHVYRTCGLVCCLVCQLSPVVGGCSSLTAGAGES